MSTETKLFVILAARQIHNAHSSLRGTELVWEVCSQEFVNTCKAILAVLVGCFFHVKELWLCINFRVAYGHACNRWGTTCLIVVTEVVNAIILVFPVKIIFSLFQIDTGTVSDAFSLLRLSCRGTCFLRVFPWLLGTFFSFFAFICGRGTLQLSLLVISPFSSDWDGVFLANLITLVFTLTSISNIFNYTSWSNSWGVGGRNFQNFNNRVNLVAWLLVKDW